MRVRGVWFEGALSGVGLLVSVFVGGWCGGGYSMAVLPLLAALIPAVIGLATSVAGGISSAKENKKQQGMADDARRRTDGELARIEGEYAKDYYSDYLSRSDVQRAMERMRKGMEDRNRRNEATASIMGSTNASVLASRKAEAEAYNNAVAEIAGNADVWKDQVKNRYNQQRAQMMGLQGYNDGQQMQLSAGRNQSNNNLISGGLGLIGSAGSSYLKGLGAKSGMGAAPSGLNNKIGVEIPKLTPSGVSNPAMPGYIPNISING